MAKNQNNNKSQSKKSQGSASQVQQAPFPEALKTAGVAGQARYIPNLMVKGNESLGYRPEYGGGGWAAGPMGDDQLRNFYKAMAITGNQAISAGSLAEINQIASGFGGPGSTATTQPSPTAQSYKGIKSITGGLRIGGDNILGKREAGRIARNTGRSYDDVIAKALDRGMSIGGAAVNKSNRAYDKALRSLDIDTLLGSGRETGLGEMRRVTPGKRQMYSGTYELDGKTTPLVESRRGGTNPMTIGGGKGKRGGKGRNKDVGTMTDSGTTFGDTAPQPMDYTPMTPQQMEAASSTDGPGMMSGGGMGAMGATGLRRPKTRLRQLGIYGRGTSLFGRGLQYGNTLNA